MKIMPLRATDRFLFLSARTGSDPAWVQALADAARAVADWEGVYLLAHRHIVAPLVHESVSRLPAGIVPQVVEEKLALDRHKSDLRNRAVFRGLCDILDTLEGVDVMLLKELAFIDATYGDRALRPIGDIDLLIRHHDVPRALERLEACGYRPRGGTDKYRRKYSSGFHLVHAQKRLWLDVQWNFYQVDWRTDPGGPFDWDMEAVWDRAVKTRLGGKPVQVMDPEDQLFHLCLHPEGHRYAELILLCDLAETLRHRGQDVAWDKFCRLVHGYRRESSAHMSLLLARHLLDAPVPIDVVRELRPPYYDAPLQTLLFGNLPGLHAFLDEMVTAASPPAFVEETLEHIVRAQVALAGMLWEELDDVLSAAHRGAVFESAWVGTHSPRVVPLSDLDAIGGIHLLVGVAGEECLRASLLEHGYSETARDCWTRPRVVTLNSCARNGGGREVALEWRIHGERFHLEHTRRAREPARMPRKGFRELLMLLRHRFVRSVANEIPSRIRVDVSPVAWCVLQDLGESWIAGPGNQVDWVRAGQLMWLQEGEQNRGKSEVPMVARPRSGDSTSAHQPVASWLANGRYHTRRRTPMAHSLKAFFYGAWASLMMPSIAELCPMLFSAFWRAFKAGVVSLAESVQATQAGRHVPFHWLDDPLNMMDSGATSPLQENG